MLLDQTFKLEIIQLEESQREELKKREIELDRREYEIDQKQRARTSVSEAWNQHLRSRRSSKSLSHCMSQLDVNEFRLEEEDFEVV